MHMLTIAFLANQRKRYFNNGKLCFGVIDFSQDALYLIKQNYLFLNIGFR